VHETQWSGLASRYSRGHCTSSLPGTCYGPRVLHLRAVLPLVGLLAACAEQKPPPNNECEVFTKVVDVAEQALGDIAEKTPDENATADDLVGFARSNAETLDATAKRARDASVTRRDLAEHMTGIEQLAALTSKGASDLADSLETLGERQAALQELEDRANGFNDEVHELAPKLQKDCPKPRCGELHRALAALGAPLALVVDVDSAAKSSLELAARFGRLAKAADSAKGAGEEHQKKLSKAAEGARTTYTSFSGALQKFIAVQERVGRSQRAAQEAFIRLKAELDAAGSACAAQEDGGAEPTPSASG